MIVIILGVRKNPVNEFACGFLFPHWRCGPFAEKWSGHLGLSMELELGSLLDGNKGKRRKLDIREGLG
jgi:hypothetical protein